MLLKIRVHPKSKREAIKKKGENEFEVWVREEAKEGRANKRLVFLFQTLFPEKRIFIKKGGKSTNKIIEVR